MTNEVDENINNNGLPTNPVETQYVDEFGNPIDPSLIDENGNYIGETVTQYVDEFGNPIDPSLIDENGNYIGETQTENPNPSDVQQNTIDQNAVANALNKASDIENLNGTSTKLPPSEPTTISSAAAHQMDDKEMLSGMVTFDYNNVPITDIVNSIILDSINKGASDIHFDPFDDGIKIRLRVDGQLNDYSVVPLYVKKNMITRIKIISGMNITESRIPQDGAIRTELQNKTIDLRVSCLPTNMGEKIVVRIMDYSMSAQGIDALDFSEENLEKIKKMLDLPNGIILVTGATGSGKSTTVYAMLQKLNVEDTNLITVEDPIEMNIGGINQVQAVSEIGLTFATVLRSILRQDPDVIMIGEIRDDETARIAVRASITGHLVLSTIHTNNSLSTIERLTDMSVERYLLGSSLSGIVSQKLSRRLCDKCKKLRPTTDYEKNIFKQALNKDVEEIYEPVGCSECSRGYRGRIAIHEVLLLNQGIKDAITKGADKADLRKLVYSNHGTDTMLQDGLGKVLEGHTSFEEILKLVDLEDDLGSGTQLGLDDQISASSFNMVDNNKNDQPTNSSQQPINITLSPEMFQNANIPPINFTPNVGQPYYVPYPVEGEEEEEEEIIIKPTKKKRKKKRIVEIDPDDFFDDEEEEIITKVKKNNKKEQPTKNKKEEIEETISEVIIEEADNTVSNQIEDSTSDEKEETKETLLETDIQEDSTVQDIVEENNTPEEIEETEISQDEAINEDNTKETNNIEDNPYQELTERMNDLLEKLHSTKKLIDKKKFNIKTQELLNKIETLYQDIKELDNDYTFNEETNRKIEELVNSINKKIKKTKNKKDIASYNKTKQRINEIFAIQVDVVDEVPEEELESTSTEKINEEIDSDEKFFDDIIKMVDEEFPIEDEPIDLSILNESIPNMEIVNIDEYETEDIPDIENEDIPIYMDDIPEITISEINPVADIDVNDLEINPNAIDDNTLNNLLDNLQDN